MSAATTEASEAEREFALAALALEDVSVSAAGQVWECRCSGYDDAEGISDETVMDRAREYGLECRHSRFDPATTELVTYVYDPERYDPTESDVGGDSA